MGTGERIQRPERLIQQQNLRIAQQRPGNRHTLGHPAGQLTRIGLFEALQLDQLNQLIDLPPDVGFPEREIGGDILLHSEPREQAVLLKNKPFINARPANLRPLQCDSAGIAGVEAGNDAQQRAFSAAAWADDRNEFAFLHLKLDILQRLHLTPGCAKALVQLCDRQQNFPHIRSSFSLNSLRRQ
ncbi:hypothetical protein D3C73_766150 [compost metagenome]